MRRDISGSGVLAGVADARAGAVLGNAAKAVRARELAGADEGACRPADHRAFLGCHLRALQGRAAAARRLHEGPSRNRHGDDQRRLRPGPAGCHAGDARTLRPGGLRRTGSSTALPTACGLRSIRPGRAISRVRLLITREGEMTTIEGSAEMTELEQWSARQLAAKK